MAHSYVRCHEFMCDMNPSYEWHDQYWVCDMIHPRVAVCCIVLQLHDSLTCARMLQCSVVHCSALQCIAVHCSAVQSIAVCYIAWQSIAVRCSGTIHLRVRVCCSVLQCIAVCCSVLQHVAACCSVLQRHNPSTCKVPCHIWDLWPTWPICICDTTHSYVWRDPIICS